MLFCMVREILAEVVHLFEGIDFYVTISGKHFSRSMKSEAVLRSGMDPKRVVEPQRIFLIPVRSRPYSNPPLAGEVNEREVVRCGSRRRLHPIWRRLITPSLRLSRITPHVGTPKVPASQTATALICSSSCWL